MSAVAATLGGSKGTLWNYFPSKEALFEAVMEHATTAYRARLSDIIAEHGPFTSTLRRLCTGIAEKLTQPNAIALHRLVVAEAERFPEIGRIFFRRGPRPTWELIAGLLSDAMDQGLIRRADPVEAARMLTNMCLAGCHFEMVMGARTSLTPEAVEQDIDRAVDLFLRAYASEAAVPD